MVPRAAVIALVLIVCLTGCTPRYVRNWGRLEAGMEQEDVHLLLGTPDLRAEPVKPTTTRPADLLPALIFGGYRQETWVYGPPGFLSGLKSLFGPSPDAYVVYFDDAHKLTQWHKPLPPAERARERDEHYPRVH